MVNKLFEHIGHELKELNPWLDTYAVNCEALVDGGKTRIVNIDGFEKKDNSINDYSGYGFYIKLLSRINFTESRKITSCENEFKKFVDFSFVFYSVNSDKQLSKTKIESLFSNQLRQLSFKDYTGEEREIKIVLLNSNINANQIFLQETGLDLISGADLVCVQINARLTFDIINENCPESCLEDIIVNDCLTE